MDNIINCYNDSNTNDSNTNGSNANDSNANDSNANDIISNNIFSNINHNTYSHQEYQYLNLIKQILDDGFWEEGRNGKTKSIFGSSLRSS